MFSNFAELNVQKEPVQSLQRPLRSSKQPNLRRGAFDNDFSQTVRLLAEFIEEVNKSAQIKECRYPKRQRQKIRNQIQIEQPAPQKKSGGERMSRAAVQKPQAQADQISLSLSDKKSCQPKDDFERTKSLLSRATKSKTTLRRATYHVVVAFLIHLKKCEKENKLQSEDVDPTSKASKAVRQFEQLNRETEDSECHCLPNSKPQ